MVSFADLRRAGREAELHHEIACWAQHHDHPIFRKDAFYFYQANWTDTPQVHIAGRRFDPRPSGPGEIKVYSNCDSVELLVNGKSLGGRSGDTCVFTWPGVTLPEGTNLVRAVGTRNGRAVMDGVTWTASAGATTRLTTP